jgi:hypothetical protein
MLAVAVRSSVTGRVFELPPPPKGAGLNTHVWSKDPDKSQRSCKTAHDGL